MWFRRLRCSNIGGRIYICIRATMYTQHFQSVNKVKARPESAQQRTLSVVDIRVHSALNALRPTTAPLCDTAYEPVHLVAVHTASMSSWSQPDRHATSAFNENQLKQVRNRKQSRGTNRSPVQGLCTGEPRESDRIVRHSSSSVEASNHERNCRQHTREDCVP